MMSIDDIIRKTITRVVTFEEPERVSLGNTEIGKEKLSIIVAWYHLILYISRQKKDFYAIQHLLRLDKQFI
jgi:hypothetical protein